ncbi:hypothetical protein HOK96_03445 [bacterium]|nr:hypothetical protein [bacterium]MBT5346071.1 hypothetical protein [bacterium]
MECKRYSLLLIIVLAGPCQYYAQTFGVNDKASSSTSTLKKVKTQNNLCNLVAQQSQKAIELENQKKQLRRERLAQIAKLNKLTAKRIIERLNEDGRSGHGNTIFPVDAWLTKKGQRACVAEICQPSVSIEDSSAIYKYRLMVESSIYQTGYIAQNTSPHSSLTINLGEQSEVDNKKYFSAKRCIVLKKNINTISSIANALSAMQRRIDKRQKFAKQAIRKQTKQADIE